MKKFDKQIIAGIISTILLYIAMVVLINYETTKKEPIKNEIQFEIN